MNSDNYRDRSTSTTTTPAPTSGLTEQDIQLILQHVIDHIQRLGNPTVGTNQTDNLQTNQTDVTEQTINHVVISTPVLYALLALGSAAIVLACIALMCKCSKKNRTRARRPTWEDVDLGPIIRNENCLYENMDSPKNLGARPKNTTASYSSVDTKKEKTTVCPDPDFIRKHLTELKAESRSAAQATLQAVLEEVKKKDRQLYIHIVNTVIKPEYEIME